MKYYSRERILLAGTKYNSRGPNITRGDHILLAETKFYLREWNITRGNVLITRGAEKLLAGTKYYSREYNITRGNELLLAGKNITRGKELLLAGIYLLLAGTIYYSRERNIGSVWHQRASVVLSHVIIQYILYFICQKLYWTVSGQLSNIGYIGQFQNEATGTLRTRCRRTKAVSMYLMKTLSIFLHLRKILICFRIGWFL